LLPAPSPLSFLLIKYKNIIIGDGAIRTKISNLFQIEAGLLKNCLLLVISGKQKPKKVCSVLIIDVGVQRPQYGAKILRPIINSAFTTTL